MAVSAEELRSRQDMPLEFKVRYSHIKIEEWIREWGPHRTYISKSGLDSEVLLDLVRSVDPSIEAVSVNTGQENYTVLERNREVSNLRWIQPDISFHQVVKKFGYPAISKMVARKLYTLQHPTSRNEVTRTLYLTGRRQDGVMVPASMLAKKWHYLIKSGYKFSAQCCQSLKVSPLKKLSGMYPFVGTLADDSEKRKMSYLKQGCNVFEGSTKQSRPLSIWTRQDIYQYALDRGLRIPACYGRIVDVGGGCLGTTGETHTGCEGCLFAIMFDPKRIERVKEWSPARYRYYMEDLDYQRLIPLLLTGSTEAQMELGL